MKQFGKILKFELTGYLKNKVFMGITLFLVIALAAVMFFPRAMAVVDSSEETPDGSQMENPPEGDLSQNDGIPAMLLLE